MELEKHKLSVAAIAAAFILLILFFILDVVYQKQFIKTDALINSISRHENKSYYIDYSFKYKNEYINKSAIKHGEIKEKIGDTNTIFYDVKNDKITDGNNYFKIAILLLVIFLTFMIPITVFRIEV